jgi:asparagine synthase (glutamine-hydrolysing)
MCGIAGIVDFKESASRLGTLRRMAESLKHRGPDAEGFAEDRCALPSVGLAHRRLSIIDLSHEADQPIANEDGSVQVLLNGEIYNYRELRGQLEATHHFRSQGDTEVIAHGYEEKGDAVVAELDGMFALAIWDGRRRRLLLARDAFGKKPLYYWSGPGCFVFGSEIKALLAAGVPTAMAEENLAEYLAFGYVPTPRTLFQGIYKLPPASILTVDAAGVREPQPYWEIPFVTGPPRESPQPRLDEAAERVGELLTAAVRKRLVADVPIGLLLSGGVDSSAVAAFMTRLAAGKVRTFSVGFEGGSNLDERRHAERVARHFGTQHVSAVVRPDAIALIDTLLDHYDEPFGGSSALPTYLIAREARRHVTVVLNGDGGDEVFAGYAWFFAALAAARLPDAARGLLKVAASILPVIGRQTSALRVVRRFAEKAARPLPERVFGWTTVCDLPQLRRLDGGRLLTARDVVASSAQALARASQASPLSQLLYLNARTYLADDLLPKMDRMTMAHGLEARSPFLDRALAEYVARLPDAFKRRGSRGKIVLKKLLEAHLPAEVLTRTKQGFGVPLADWFRSELRELTSDMLLSSPRLGARLSVGEIRRLFDEHQSRRSDRAPQLFILLMLEAWLRKHRLA